MSFRADRLGRNGFTPVARALLNRAGGRVASSFKNKNAPGWRKTGCNELRHHFAPTMSAACCGPPRIKEARAKRARNEITAEALRAVEDREIEKAIRKQEEIGLKLATDGEFRRSW